MDVFRARLIRTYNYNLPITTEESQMSRFRSIVLTSMIMDFTVIHLLSAISIGLLHSRRPSVWPILSQQAAEKCTETLRCEDGK